MKSENVVFGDGPLKFISHPKKTLTSTLVEEPLSKYSHRCSLLWPRDVRYFNRPPPPPRDASRWSHKFRQRLCQIRIPIKAKFCKQSKWYDLHTKHGEKVELNFYFLFPATSLSVVHFLLREIKTESCYKRANRLHNRLIYFQLFLLPSKREESFFFFKKKWN